MAVEHICRHKVQPTIILTVITYNGKEQDKRYDLG